MTNFAFVLFCSCKDGSVEYCHACNPERCAIDYCLDSNVEYQQGDCRACVHANTDDDHGLDSDYCGCKDIYYGDCCENGKICDCLIAHWRTVALPPNCTINNNHYEALNVLSLRLSFSRVLSTGLLLVRCSTVNVHEVLEQH